MITSNEGGFFFVGDNVNVKALKGDSFKDFTGHIISIDELDIVRVEDEDGDIWECTSGQLKHSSDDILHQYD